MGEEPPPKTPPMGFKTWSEFYEYGATVILPRIQQEERERKAAEVAGVNPPPRGSRTDF